MEYLINHWLDLSQNLDFSLGDQTESKFLQMKKNLNGRWPQNIESGIYRQPQISKVEYPSHHWLDLSQNLDFSLGDQIESKNSIKWRWPQNIEGGIYPKLIGSF